MGLRSNDIAPDFGAETTRGPIRLPEGRTAAGNATVRSVLVVGPARKVKLMPTYPMTTGRNFHQIPRGLDSVQPTARHQLATSVHWQPGDDPAITPAASNEETERSFTGFEWVRP